MSQVICLDSSDEENNELRPPTRKRRRIQPTMIPPDELAPVVTAKQASAILSECTLIPLAKLGSEQDQSIETVNLDSDDESTYTDNAFDYAKQETKDELVNSENPEDCLDLTIEPLEKGEISNSGEIQKIEFVNLSDDDTPTKSAKSVSIMNDNATVDLSGDEADDPIYICTDSELETSNILPNKSIIENGSHDISETVSLDGTDSEDERINSMINGNNSDLNILVSNSDTESNEKGKENHSKNGQFEFERREEKKNDIPVEHPKPSTSKSTDDICETKMLLEKFLGLVESKVVGSQFEKGISEKIPRILKYLNKCGANAKHKSLITLLNDSILNFKNGTASTAVIAFQRVFEHLKMLSDRATVQIEEQHVPVLRKLEKTIKLLTKKIKELEEREVDFDDEEDSAYIQADKYTKRLNNIYAKYCKYIRKNPCSGRITYDKINFCNSAHNEINLAINRKYKNSLKFPTYYEVEKYIEKICTSKKLNLSESEIKYESGQVFKELGRIMQKRRKTELYDCHVNFIQNSEDPASKDIHLENTLKKNLVEGEQKIEKLCEKFSARQDLGEDQVSSSPASSDCSDDEPPT